MRGRDDTRFTTRRVALLVVLSALAHVVMFAVFAVLAPHWRIEAYHAPVRIQVLQAEPLPGEAVPDSLADALLVPVPEDEAVEEIEEPEPEPELPKGQIVETPRPDEEKEPLQADYLAEHDNAVPEETRTEQFKVNPEILANQYSEESKLQLDEAEDVGATEESTGATAGGIDVPADGKGPPRSAIPSQFAITNKEGLAAPVPSSALKQSIAGSPQNDLLNEKEGQAVALNTREFVAAAYLNRIRRQVNLYWNQNIENLSSSVRLSKPRYVTVVDVTLNADGRLESIEVTDESGSEPLDLCVVDAFRVAGPFPNPPEQLIARDGRVYLPDFDFTVQLGHATMRYSGIDPRGGVQFPGILNSPR